MKIIKTYTKASDISYQLPSTNNQYTILFSNNISGISFVGENNLSNISDQIIAIQHINSNIINLNNYCFNNCNNLNYINLPPNIEQLNIYCFNNCNNLKNIIFPIFESYISNIDQNMPKLNEIKNYTFNGCIELLTLIIPDSITEFSQIDENAFNGSNLTSITFLGIESNQFLGE